MSTIMIVSLSVSISISVTSLSAPLHLILPLTFLHLLKFLFLPCQWYRRMIIETLSHQLQSQRILDATWFLQFGPFILEPDFNLSLIQAQLGAQLLASFFRQVTILIKFMLNMKQRIKRFKWRQYFPQTKKKNFSISLILELTLRRANWEPLKAVRGRLSSPREIGDVPSSLWLLDNAGFLIRRTLGPEQTNRNNNNSNNTHTHTKYRKIYQ